MPCFPVKYNILSSYSCVTGTLSSYLKTQKRPLQQSGTFFTIFYALQLFIFETAM
ncbi:hypothetical protein CLOSTHATH_03883 [Hungatella hathewayi DSM 13479]|uniref:Uncharacterized protein n=1 Tax=Hungatella hathewayi DSM 13479 TaxID=566550 RepID=D3AJU0_9FIRM|nr:hypothetical protein CLOSTHATH_03883 [Hungatella hathewayi DSM 13479]